MSNICNINIWNVLKAPPVPHWWTAAFMLMLFSNEGLNSCWFKGCLKRKFSLCDFAISNFQIQSHLGFDAPSHHCHWMCKNNLIFTAVKNWHFICPFYWIIDLIGSILKSILISASNWFSSYKYIRAAQTSLKRTKFFYFAAIYLSSGY